MLGAPGASVAEDEIDWRTGTLGATGEATGDDRVEGLKGIGMLTAEPLDAGGVQGPGAAGGIDVPGAGILGIAPIGAADKPVGFIPCIVPGSEAGIAGALETGAPNPDGIAPGAIPAGGMLRAGW
jgi:hypothetical protein